MKQSSDDLRTHQVWAPYASKVELILEPEGIRLPLVNNGSGYFILRHEAICPGQRYTLSLDGGPGLPDPRSELQPEGVHGPSCWVDFDEFSWSDQEFQPRPLQCAVFYELHVGTFTQGGTFEAAIERLPELCALGVTHVEVMPIAHFAGTRGWGYDGVALFAPHTAYGGPLGFQRFVDACHHHGLAVILDVVYNHLGPSGNYLAHFGPYFTKKYHTPWGAAVNYDDEGSDEVRAFVCDNARYWLQRYHVDGLRLDAVHAIFDHSAPHILAQLSREVDKLSVQLGRPLLLVAESGINDPRLTNPEVVGGYGLHSQWNDDFHHALHAYVTQERLGYYRDFGSLAAVASALAHGFVHRPKYSQLPHVSLGDTTPMAQGRQLVVFAQNHDQVGNRAIGDRLTATLTHDVLKIVAALTLLGPSLPLIFMGEEWACAQPFQYFADHDDMALRQAVREGRRQEFAAFGWEPSQIPDPAERSTFENSKLDWHARERSPHAEMLAWYTQLLRLRRQLGGSDDQLQSTRVAFDEREQWLYFSRGAMLVACNFAAKRRTWTFAKATLRLSSSNDVQQVNDDFDAQGHSVVIFETSNCLASSSGEFVDKGIQS